MTQGWHYWLFEGADDRPPLPPEEVPDVFTSFEDAKAAATRLGRPIDIYRTPQAGGMAEFVESVGGDATVTPDPVEAKIEVILPAIETSAAGKIKPTGQLETRKTVSKDLGLRWNVEAPPNIHLRGLKFHPPSATGEPWRIEALDESGNVLASGMGEPEDAYLELWEEIKPPDS